MKKGAPLMVVDGALVVVGPLNFFRRCNKRISHHFWTNLVHKSNKLSTTVPLRF